MKKSSEFLHILLGAVKRETEAFNHYYRASQKAPSPEARSLLLQLAEEERRHRTILLQEYKNLRKFASGQKEDVFLEKQRVSFHLPDKPDFRRVQSLKKVDLAVVSLPTEFVGGDFFDTFIIKDEDKMGFLVFDVMGHGLDATELKTAAQAEWGRLKELFLDKEAPSLLLNPSSVVTRLNQHLMSVCHRLGSFLSLFYAVLDRSKRILTYASAGHEPPLLFQKKGYSQLIEGDLLLCIDKGRPYRDISEGVRLGDVLVMFTDGVVESMNEKEEEFSVRNLIRVVEENRNSTAAEIIQQILIALKSFTGGKPVVDEFTLAVAKIR
jgi:sigma-B regulation protein RsbU (phosphoserine phosphatase)